jgi:hypothetical protein
MRPDPDDFNYAYEFKYNTEEKHRYDRKDAQCGPNAPASNWASQEVHCNAHIIQGSHDPRIFEREYIVLSCHHLNIDCTYADDRKKKNHETHVRN